MLFIVRDLDSHLQWQSFSLIWVYELGFEYCLAGGSGYKAFTGQSMLRDGKNFKWRKDTPL